MTVVNLIHSPLARYDPHAAYKSPGDNSKKMMQKIYPSERYFISKVCMQSDEAQYVLELARLFLPIIFLSTQT